MSAPVCPSVVRRSCSSVVQCVASLLRSKVRRLCVCLRVAGFPLLRTGGKPEVFFVVGAFSTPDWLTGGVKLRPQPPKEEKTAWREAEKSALI